MLARVFPMIIKGGLNHILHLYQKLKYALENTLNLPLAFLSQPTLFLLSLQSLVEKPCYQLIMPCNRSMVLPGEPRAWNQQHHDVPGC